MKRGGKELRDLGDGHPRRVADAKNAWRKASEAQRAELLRWIASEEAGPVPHGCQIKVVQR